VDKRKPRLSDSTAKTIIDAIQDTLDLGANNAQMDIEFPNGLRMVVKVELAYPIEEEGAEYII
jgi:hypothetical protein